MSKSIKIGHVEFKLEEELCRVYFHEDFLSVDYVMTFYVNGELTTQLAEGEDDNIGYGIWKMRDREVSWSWIGCSGTLDSSRVEYWLINKCSIIVENAITGANYA